MDARRRGFTREIHFCAPGLKRYETAEFCQRTPEKFVAVSITGPYCPLKCEHCKGHLLRSMRCLRPRETLLGLCQRLAKGGTEGVLISGGSDLLGRVPLQGFIDDMGRIKRELTLQVLVHGGLVDEELARSLKEANVDGALIDIVGSDQTIAEVCHLAATVEDYERSLYLLIENDVPAMPHIVLGLHYGRILGEWRALELVSSHPVAALVVVVITPLEGTPMAGVRPPSLGDVDAFLRAARLRLPEIPILLGCARPGGPYKEELDRLAVDAGVNGIAYPAEGTVEHARMRGLTPRFSEECCSLIYKQITRGRLP